MNEFVLNFTLLLLCLMCVAATRETLLAELCSESLNVCLWHDGYRTGSVQSALEHCQRNGSRLLEIRSQAMQHFVQYYVERSIVRVADRENFKTFIGLRRVDLDNYVSVSTGKYISSDPEQFNKMPNACYSLSSYCVYEGEFECDECHTTQGRTIQMIGRYMTWHQARQHCLDRSSSLLTFGLKHPRVYDGGHVDASRMLWLWPGEDNFTSYTNWKGGCDYSAYGDDSKCSLMLDDFTWFSSTCSIESSLPVVCMKASRGTSQSSSFAHLYAVVAVLVTMVIVLSVVILYLATRLARQEARDKRETFDLESPPPNFYDEAELIPTTK